MDAIMSYVLPVIPEIVCCILLTVTLVSRTRKLHVISLTDKLTGQKSWGFFKKKSFWRTHVLFWGHWYPCFEFLVTSPLGFKARVGSVLFAFFWLEVMFVSKGLKQFHLSMPIQAIAVFIQLYRFKDF